jgi:fructose-1,6-bisphosphatase/inositol monophosphatase family enzyme
VTPDTLHTAIETLLHRVAETAILPRYRTLSADQIIEKAEDDLVTIADREAEAMLAEGLETIVPGLPIVGEEAAYADPTVLERLSGDCWIVDPIDGTHNFAHGQPPFGILIAMASGGEGHTGWIYDVPTRRLCIAHRGKGAFIGGERVTATTSGENPPVAAISTIFMDPWEREMVRANVSPHYRLVDTPRCAAEQYPRLALGQNDVSIFNRTLAWDHAAGVLWLNEAGGKAARPDGSPYRVDERDRTGLLGAANPALWDKLAERYGQL